MTETNEQKTYVNASIEVELGASSGGDAIGCVVYAPVEDYDVEELTGLASVQALADAGLHAVKAFERAWIFARLRGFVIEEEERYVTEDSEGEFNFYFSDAERLAEQTLSRVTFDTEDERAAFAHEEDRSHTVRRVTSVEIDTDSDVCRALDPETRTKRIEQNLARATRETLERLLYLALRRDTELSRNLEDALDKETGNIV